MQIAFLGLGKMGGSIAHLLVKQHSLTVWNRTAAACEPLVQLGAKSAATPVEAVQHADIVFTMLLDDVALEDILFAQGVLAAMPAHSIHVSLSTISVALAERLEQAHATHRQRLISSPVFGRPSVASEGKLWLAVAGPAGAIDEARPLLEVFSRGITLVGERPSQANAAKVAGNFLISSMIASLSEAFTVAESKGIDPSIFLETVNSALFQSPFYANYGKLMIDPPAEVGATVKLGAKDTRLFREAAASVPTPLADLYRDRFDAAIEAGRGDADWAAGYFAQTRAEAK
ncbi:3-hydroxyisobutyrate dehydrogenase [Granulicella rosea]|uniref:3-hydroxyisobutyrate dehydrogenase n=1 Tax=Granulicella rosea TaxID=474952 RepID=A0A239M3Y2_9BACT|nr:NAD(P)-dependent oxidoreductase [Granulicella rosea]SNT36823.1 3-hydroxyisobutyrate dehydrogenase [Granulicella rosea]